MPSPSRPVIAFALLKQCGDLLQTDLLGGVAVLIRPLVSDLAGQVYDAGILASRMAAAYGISLPPSALEDFTPRLASAGILVIEESGSGFNRAVYAVNSLQAPESERDESLFQGIIDDFVAHAKLRLFAASVVIEEEDLVSGFLRRLCTLDFSSARVRPIVQEEHGSNTLLGPAAREARILSEQLTNDAAIDAVVASYIGAVQAKNPDWLNVLSEVAEGALGLELVLDLQAPTSVPRLTNTTAVIDTPILLSYLDLSSKQQHEAAISLIEQLKQSGAKIAAFQHSIEEAESVLHAIESARQTGAAYGPTVQRMSSSSYRAFFATMRGRIGWEWQQRHKFELVQETAIQFYKNFTEEDEVDLTKRIRTSIIDRYLTSERDAKSVAETMRRLGGGHIPIGNLSSCRYVFVTGNTSVQRRSAAFLKERDFVRRGEFVPIITDRYAAGLCWLISGGRSENSPTTARLLANCAVALRARPELVKRTKLFLADLDEEKANHFEALMTNERASQYLMEFTLGNLEVITANNVEDIFAEAQRRAAETVSKEKDEHYGQKISELATQLESGAHQLIDLRVNLQQVVSENATKDFEANALKEKAEKLEIQLLSQREVALNQGQKIAAMESSVAELTNVATDAIVANTKRKAQATKLATRYSTRRIFWAKLGGAALFIVVTIVSALLDKFWVSTLAVPDQKIATLGLIAVQAITAILGISLLFEKMFAGPLKRWGARLFNQRLAELGYEAE